jgi:hypothetical protein
LFPAPYNAQTVLVNTGALVVNNDAFSIFMRVTWPGAAGPTAMQLRDVRVNYTVTTPLPEPAA